MRVSGFRDSHPPISKIFLSLLLIMVMPTAMTMND